MRVIYSNGFQYPIIDHLPWHPNITTVNTLVPIRFGDFYRGNCASILYVLEKVNYAPETRVFGTHFKISWSWKFNFCPKIRPLLQIFTEKVGNWIPIFMFLSYNVTRSDFYGHIRIPLCDQNLWNVLCLANFQNVLKFENEDVSVYDIFQSSRNTTTL